MGGCCTKWLSVFEGELDWYLMLVDRLVQLTLIPLVSVFALQHIHSSSDSYHPLSTT
jgi:hypothetical protein